MAAPRMYIIAGPPGAGKSSIFSLSHFASRTFNADDRAAQLNGGSYQGIPSSIRAAANQEFEQFVIANVHAKQSFALETTLRSDISFKQAKIAHAEGFRVSMRYIALDSPEKHIQCIKERAAGGGHAASEATLRRIHAASLANLPTALNPQRSGIEFVRVYDNSRDEHRPQLVLAVTRGRIIRLASEFPLRLKTALGWSERDLARHRQYRQSKTVGATFEAELEIDNQSE